MKTPGDSSRQGGESLDEKKISSNTKKKSETEMPQD